jgi:hypothetical protein
MTFQISQRGKEYSETAGTLLRAAETMTEPSDRGSTGGACRHYQRRSEKASQVDAAKALTARLLALKESEVHDNIPTRFEPRSANRSWSNAAFSCCDSGL